MPDYRKQHWLPAAYLKFFAVDRTERSRKSLIYRLDSSTCRKVSVDSQCFQKYFYSKENPKEAEKSFHHMEWDYPRIVRLLERSKNSLSVNPKEYFGLIYIIVDFHLRNNSYINNRGTENIEAFAFRRQNFWHREIMLWLQTRQTYIPSPYPLVPELPRPILPSVPLSSEAATKDFSRNLFSFTRDVWRFQSLECEQDFFVTSDNPSIWFENDGLTTAFLMPLTPEILGIAYDQRRIKMLSSKATLRDVELVNSFQIIQCNRSIYSAFLLEKRDLKVLPKLFAKNRNSQQKRGFVNDKQWGLETIPVYFQNKKGDYETFSFWELIS